MNVESFLRVFLVVRLVVVVYKIMIDRIEEKADASLSFI